MTGRRLTADERRICKGLSETTVLKSVGTALCDHLLIIFSGGAALVVYSFAGILIGAFAALIAWPIILRSMRGLECLVHEGSHRNWYRHNGRINDLLTDSLAAVPMLSTVAAYRGTHLEHHRYFNTERDIDLRRHRQHNFSILMRTNGFYLVPQLLRRYVRYLPGWWRAIGTNIRTVILFSGWHISILILPAVCLLGFLDGIFWWSIYWFIPFFFILPLLRMFGEAGEHDYSLAGGSYELTFTNRSWFHRYFLYPHNDGFHTLHHMYPSIPHFLLKRAHYTLASAFPKYWAHTPLERV
jgi:fatty acid desaturase